MVLDLLIVVDAIGVALGILPVEPSRVPIRVRVRVRVSPEP